MKASASVLAVQGSRGTQITDLRCEPPLVMRETPDALYLVGAAGGPLGGDELSLQIEVGAGARLRVRSAAATLAQPGPLGVPSYSTTTIAVGADGSLAWQPEPLVSVRGSHHHVDTFIDLHADARLVLVEELVLGRFAEEPGRVTTRLRVNRGGLPIVAHDLDVGPGALAWAGPAVIGAARAIHTELHVGADAATVASVQVDGDNRVAVFPLADGVAMVVALAGSLTAARKLARYDHSERETT